MLQLCSNRSIPDSICRVCGQNSLSINRFDQFLIKTCPGATIRISKNVGFLDLRPIKLLSSKPGSGTSETEHAPPQERIRTIWEDV